MKPRKQGMSFLMDFVMAAASYQLQSPFDYTPPDGVVLLQIGASSEPWALAYGPAGPTTEGVPPPCGSGRCGSKALAEAKTKAILAAAGASEKRRQAEANYQVLEAKVAQLRKMEAQAASAAALLAQRAASESTAVQTKKDLDDKLYKERLEAATNVSKAQESAARQVAEVTSAAQAQVAEANETAALRIHEAELHAAEAEEEARNTVFRMRQQTADQIRQIEDSYEQRDKNRTAEAERAEVEAAKDVARYQAQALAAQQAADQIMKVAERTQANVASAIAAEAKKNITVPTIELPPAPLSPPPPPVQPPVIIQQLGPTYRPVACGCQARGAAAPGAPAAPSAPAAPAAAPLSPDAPGAPAAAVAPSSAAAPGAPAAPMPAAPMPGAPMAGAPMPAAPMAGAPMPGAPATGAPMPVAPMPGASPAAAGASPPLLPPSGPIPVVQVPPPPCPPTPCGD